MREADFSAFSSLLDDVVGMYPKGSVTSGQTAMFFRALSAYSIAEVRAGFDAHVRDTQRGQFQPMPSHILAQIEGLSANDGRPGPEEAWAKALRAADEQNTVVWTEEMAEAWGIAQPVIANGDEVGARMAFREAYTRLIDAARRARRAPVWMASLGFDMRQRAEALQSAHMTGQLPAPDLLALPAPAEPFKAIVTSPQIPEGVRAKLMEVRHRLSVGRKEGDAMKAHEQTQRLKDRTAQMVAERTGA